ncbi:MAG: hypothetical protein WC612_05420 [Bdellovibrionales bacterium]|jgi:cell division protein FtsL
MTRASTILFWFSLTLFVSLGLYHTSYQVEHNVQQLKNINAQIEAQQRSLHILKAEWVFLSNPARLEVAARKYLALQPTTPSQITKLSKLAALLPTHNEATETTKVAEAAPAPIVTAKEQHPAAPNPKATSDEKNRLNTRMILQKTASVQPSAHETAGLPWHQDTSYTLANSGDEP